MSDQTRQLAAILSTDAVDYSRHMSRDESGTDAVVSKCLAEMRRIVDEHRGRTISFAGDGFIAIFDSATKSIECARALSEASARQNLRIGDDLLEFRTGMCMGEIILRDDSAFGEAVNIAKRLEQLAPPGHVYVSQSLYSEVVGRTGAGFEFLGEKQLKNIPQHVSTYRLLPSLEVALRTPSPRRTTATDAEHGRPVLAVLPLDDFSAEKDKSWLCDCLTEEIILRMSRFRSIPVISRNSVFALRSNNWSVKRIAAELNARYVLEGSLRTAGTQVRVTAQLIDADQDRHSWSARFDGDLGDMFSFQDAISEALVGQLVGGIEAAEERRAHAPSPTAGTYEKIARARQLYWRWERPGIDEAERMCRECIADDPRSAAAWSLLSRISNTRWLFGWTADPDAAMRDSENAARRATALDIGDARAHADLGLVLLFQRKHQLSLQAYERALAINPNDADILADYADLLQYLRRPEEALTHIRRAMVLNPSYPDGYLWNLADIYFELDRHEDVVATVYQMRNPLLGSRLLAASFALLGREQEAQAVARNVLLIHPEFSVTEWTRKQPDINEASVAKFAKGLRLAGLPD